MVPCAAGRAKGIKHVGFLSLQPTDPLKRTQSGFLISRRKKSDSNVIHSNVKMTDATNQGLVQ